MEGVERVNGAVGGFVWGPVMLCFFLAVGIYFTVRTRWFQVTRFGMWMRTTFCSLFRKERGGGDEKSISQFQALSTALAASLGTGNIVGVATALYMGGPGAIFWMWISTFFGMMTSYAENVLGIKYRYRNTRGEWVGGAMVYMEKGIHSKPMAVLFAVFCVFASFGIGNMSQANSVAAALETTFHVPLIVTGSILAVLFVLVVSGGIRRIARVAELLVPFMAIGYLAAGLIVIACHYRNIPAAFSMIFQDAFDFRPAASGLTAYGISRAVRYGISRGVFSNEAGMGSAVIAHAAADTKEPAEQGMWGMFEVFADTIVMCTITALVILTSGVWQPHSSLNGAALSTAAFATVFGPWGGRFIAVSIALFAFATLIGWSYYGEQSIAWLFHGKGVFLYRLVFLAFIVLGSCVELGLVWDISDTFNGLMAIPNLIALILLSREVLQITDSYLDRKGRLKPHRDMGRSV